MSEEKQEEPTIEEMIDELGQELLATGFTFVKRAGKGDKPTDEEVAANDEKHKYFKSLCGTYNMLKKAGRISGGNEDKNFNNNFLKKVKGMKNTIGEIVTEVPPPLKEKDE